MTGTAMRAIAPSEGGAASTDWSHYTLDQIWEMVRTEDGVITYAQIDAWRRLAELCAEQADQLEKAMNQLLERWPARPGSASEAFARRVTALATSMRQATQAAVANQQPLRDITNALASARLDIGALVEARQRYSLVEQQLTPQPNPSPGQTPIPAAPVGLQPPPKNWRAGIEQQARSVMAHADGAVGVAAIDIQTPPYYFLGAVIQDDTRPLNSDPGSLALNATGIADYSPILARTGPDSRPQPAQIPVSYSDDSTMNPVLNGEKTAGPSLAGLHRSPVADQMHGSGLPSELIITPPLTAVLAPGEAIGPPGLAPKPTNIQPASNGTNQIPRPDTTYGHAGIQGMPIAPLMPPRDSRAAQPGMALGGRLGRNGRRWPRNAADPDNPWGVAEGGPSILEPEPESSGHDPGPGIIGFDR